MSCDGERFLLTCEQLMLNWLWLEDGKVGVSARRSPTLSELWCDLDASLICDNSAIQEIDLMCVGYGGAACFLGGPSNNRRRMVWIFAPLSQGDSPHTTQHGRNHRSITYYCQVSLHVADTHRLDADTGLEVHGSLSFKSTFVLQRIYP